MFSVRPITSRKSLARYFRITSLFSVVGFEKKQTASDTVSLYSASFGSQFFRVTVRTGSVLFPLNGNWGAPVTSGAVWCESWPWCLLETEDVITWMGAPVLRDRRCMVNTSRNCSAVFPHNRNLCWMLLFFLLLSGSSEQLCRSALYQGTSGGTLGTAVMGMMQWTGWGSVTPMNSLCQLVLSCQFLKSCLPELSSFAVSVKQAHVLGHEEKKQHFY